MFWAVLESAGVSLRAVLGVSWAVLGCPGGILGCAGLVLGCPGLSGESWGVLSCHGVSGLSWAVLEAALDCPGCALCDFSQPWHYWPIFLLKR